MRKPSLFYDKQRNRGRLLSASAHVLFLVVVLFGLPSFLSPTPPPEPIAISVEILPIGAVSNVKPSQTPPDEPKPEEKKPTQKKEAPPVKVAENTPPPPPPEKVAPVPLPKKEEKKPEPKKEEPKKEEKKKNTDQDFMAVLKAVKDTVQQDKKETKKDIPQDKPSPTKNVSSHFDENMPAMMALKDSVIGQISRCWNPPIGAKDAQNLQIFLNVEYNSDGSYVKVELSSQSRGRYDSDSFFRAAADSAIRAVKQCSPLKNLPADKFDAWHYMELNFDPKAMLN